MSKIFDHPSEEDISRALWTSIEDDKFTGGRRVTVELKLFAVEIIPRDAIEDAALDMTAIAISKLQAEIMKLVRTREHEMKTRPLSEILESMNEKRLEKFKAQE